MISTAQVEQILDKFNIELANFDIVNLEEKKGWSSKFLYLIVEQDEQYLLKGKYKDQLEGFLSDILISDYLSSKGFSVREAIKSKEGNYHFIDNDIFWELKSYIPGSVEDFTEYTEETVRSLAKINISYINASLNNEDAGKLGLDIKDFSSIEDKMVSFMTNKEILTNIIGDATNISMEWFKFAQVEAKKIITKNKDWSIIHNDLNNKNILLDLKSNNVTHFIDWDHGCISTPLKDILEPLNMFFDFVPQKYENLRSVYLNEITKKYNLQISDSEVNFLQVYFYALNKWNYIAFFAKLIKDVGNSTNELADFENVVKTQLNNLDKLGKLYKVF